MCDPTVVLRALEKFSRLLDGQPSAKLFDELDTSLGIWTKRYAGDNPTVVHVTREMVAEGNLNPSSPYFEAVMSLIEDAVERTRPLEAVYGELDELVRRRNKLPSLEKKAGQDKKVVSIH